MIRPDGSDHEDPNHAKLARRDWILLPLLGLLTIGILLVSMEAIARRRFASIGNLGRSCLVNDPVTGVHARPNCVASEKNPDTPLVEYRFNSCGHRTSLQCGVKPEGTYRIVMIGTSTPMGYNVAESKSFATLLPVELSHLAGRKVDLYNEGLVRNSPRFMASNFEQILVARPDLLLWVVTPFDLEGKIPEPEAAVAAQTSTSSPLLKRWERMKEAFDTQRDKILVIWNRHDTSSLINHYLYESKSLYVKSSLREPDEKVGFLKSIPSAEWQHNLRMFDINVGDVAQHAKAADLPLVIVLVPTRQDVAMLSIGEWPAGYDPNKLDSELRSIVTAHGATYIDILPYFRTIPNPEQYYFAFDGHPDENGHALISGMLTLELTSGVVPALRSDALPAKPAAAGPGK